MSVCPNCGKEPTEGSLRCEHCGNPLTEGRPWDKKSKEQIELEEKIEEEAKARRANKENKTKVQTEIRPNLSKFNFKKSPVKLETYLDHDFVIGMSLCGFGEEPGNKKNLTSGTVILTKDALLFGRSEYEIKCGYYKIEIPLEYIDSFGEAMDGNKKLIVIRTVQGEAFYLFVAKRSEWLDYFCFALHKENHPEDVVREKKTSVKKWLLTAGYLVIAFSCFTAAMMMQLDTSVNTLVFVCGFGFLVLAAYNSFRKKE